MDEKISVEMIAPGSEGQKSTASTGPRTAEGKRRTKYNAIQHGIFADIVLASEPFRESGEDYIELQRVFYEAIQPADGLEKTLVEQLAFEFLRLSRVYKADLQVTPLVFERITRMLKDGSSLVQTELIEVDKGREVVVLQKGLDPELVLRYGNSISKQIDRILDRLEHLRAARLSRPNREASHRYAKSTLKDGASLHK